MYFFLGYIPIHQGCHNPFIPFKMTDRYLLKKVFLKGIKGILKGTFKCTFYVPFIYIFYFHGNSYSSYSVKLLKICTLIISIPNFLYILVIVDLVIIVIMDIKHSSLSNIL